MLVIATRGRSARLRALLTIAFTLSCGEPKSGLIQAEPSRTRRDLAAEALVELTLPADVPAIDVATEDAPSVQPGLGTSLSERERAGEERDPEVEAAPLAELLPAWGPTEIDSGPTPQVSAIHGLGSEIDSVVVLDPGHGGYDEGATAFGLTESALALDIALRARDALEAREPSIRVLLTRSDDTFVSLEQRSTLANAVRADAFVSIHLNSADEAVRNGGITSFVLDTTGDRQAMALAARENGSSAESVGVLATLIAQLERRDQSASSRRLAQDIQWHTLREGQAVYPGLYDRGCREATFAVLVGAMMPAVLVEVSFLTFEADARALRERSYRAALARGLADGIIVWVEARRTPD